jgi:hypothetical protein
MRNGLGRLRLAGTALIVAAALAYPFHPNRRGEQVMAAQVLAALRS